MVLQRASLEILDIPENLFPEVSDFVRNFLQNALSEFESYCTKLNYPPAFFLRWVHFTRYEAESGSIENDCTVYAPSPVFLPLLRTLIQELAKIFPRCCFHGSFSLLNSNWGYDTYPFRTEQGVLIWKEETLARQQPRMRKFWEAMTRSGYTDIPDLLTAMYAPMTDRQLYDAFGLLDDLFFDPMQEVQPVDAYYFDEEGIPERESMVEFTHNCFLGYCWQRYADIWDFFRAVKEAFSRKHVPFDFPDGFLTSETNPDF